VRVIDAIRPGIRGADLRAAAALAPISPVTPVAFASPWATPAHLERVVWTDVFGVDAREHRPLSRAEAMRVPAVARARHIIAGTIGRIDMHGYRGDAPLPADPPWVAQTSGPLSPFHRNLWTADDLFFSGWSLWWRSNGADGFPLRTDRLPMGQWTFDTSGNVLVDRLDGYGFRGVNADDVILIPGPHEGLLTFAARSIRIASNIERSVDRAAATPAATLNLHQTGGDPMPYDSDDPETFTVRKLIDGWVDARHGRNGGVAFTEPVHRSAGTRHVRFAPAGRRPAGIGGRHCPAFVAAGRSDRRAVRRRSDVREQPRQRSARHRLRVGHVYGQPCPAGCRRTT
jgi:hypothetical protein